MGIIKEIIKKEGEKQAGGEEREEEGRRRVCVGWPGVLPPPCLC